MNHRRKSTVAWKRLGIALTVLIISLFFLLPVLSVFSSPLLSSYPLVSNIVDTTRLLMPLLIKNQPYLPHPLITEVLYDPEDEPGGEWVELYNDYPITFDLSIYKIGDQTEPGCCEGMLAFPPGASLKPGQVIVIANEATKFRSFHGFNPDYEMKDTDPGVPDLLCYWDWAQRAVVLTNTGDDLLLLDGDDAVVDAVSWGDASFAFIPPVSKVTEGYSLERYPAYMDTDSALDWRSQKSPQPGEVNLIPPTPTPGPPPTEVPVPTPVPTLIINEIHAYPDLGAGDANGDTVISRYDDEFVEIFNDTGSPIDLGGWVLSTNLGNRHEFPSPTLIMNGCSVVIFGGGLPTGEFGGSLIQISSTGSLNLGNMADKISLFDAAEKEIYWVEYISGGIEESITRDPDITGFFFVPHTSVSPIGALFSPGTMVDGSPFSGCLAEEVTLNSSQLP